MLKKIIKLLALLSFLYLIFFFSNQTGKVSSNLSGNVTSVIYNFLIKFFPISLNGQQFLLKFETLIRKTAHVSEYLFLTVLVYLNIKEYFKNKTYILSFITTLAFAIIDELHQLKVLERSGSIKDVLIDSIGIFIGLLIIYIINLIFKQKKKHNGN